MVIYKAGGGVEERAPRLYASPFRSTHSREALATERISLLAGGTCPLLTDFMH